VLASRQTTDGLAAMNFAYQYAVGGALSGMQYPSGRWVTYTINGANRPSAVRNGQSGTSYYMQNVQYKPSGAFSSATVGLDTANQWTETREYNSLLQARKLRLVKGTQKLLGLDWIYSANSQYNSSQDMYEETGTDNNGNLRMEKLAHTVGTPFSVDRSFDYDTANRLTTFNEPMSAKSQYFGYDAFGNLWQTGASGVPALRPNGSSWYLLGSGQVSNRLANTAYDAVGHQTQLSLTPGTTASYDAEGRVSRVELNSNPVATYDYDADGRRVKKTVGATTTHYVYSADGQLMAEYGGTPTSVGTRYLVADHLGSTRLILDAQGNCSQRIDYAPFGAQLTRSGQPCYTSSTSGLPLFTGQLRDGESAAGTDTGLDYFNARYFWATLGRFSSPDAPLIDQDAMDPQSWNLYSYVRNNPLTFKDPSGQDCIYTHTLDEEAGTVLIERGSCSQKGGTYVAGTIDSSSVNLNSNSGRLNYAFTGYESQEYTFADLELPDPSIQALQRGVGLAAPGVNLASEGLMLFGSIVATVPMAIAQYVSGNGNGTSLAMAMVPGGNRIKLGGKILNVNPNVPLRAYLVGSRLAKGKGFPDYLLDMTGSALKTAVEKGVVSPDQVKKIAKVIEQGQRLMEKLGGK